MLAVVMILFLVLLVLNIPIGFAMMAPAVLYLIVTPGVQLSIAMQRMMGGVDTFSLLSIPLFILAGNIMNVGTVTDRIFDFANTVTKHIRGGLGYANILASIIFAGMSGSACADAASLGAIEIKAMKDHGYDDDIALGITGGSAIIGPIFPPSMPMIMLAYSSGQSLGKLFATGIIPGLVMGAALCVPVYLSCRKKEGLREEAATFKEMAKAFWEALPCVMMPVLMLLGIYSGIFTPTETAAIVSVYCIILACAYKKMTWENIKIVVRDTARQSTTIGTICAGGTLFGYVLSNERVPQLLVNFFVQNISSVAVFWIVIIIAFLIAGCFLDDSICTLIVIPMLLPVAGQMGIHPLHFSLICVLLLMVGLLTPPVGMVLYVLQGVTKIPFEKISVYVFPYILTLLITVIILIFIPAAATWLPSIMF